MRLFAIKKLTFFLNNPKIDLWHYLAFHGFEFRGSNWRNDATASAITSPNIEFVVDLKLAPLFRGLSGVSLESVGRVRCFHHEVREGDFTHWDEPGVVGTDEYFMRTLVTREVKNSGATALRVLVPQITAPIPSGDRYVFALGPTEWDPPVEIQVEPAFKDQYPLFRWGDTLFCSPTLFHTIEEFISPTFFLVKSAEPL